MSHQTTVPETLHRGGGLSQPIALPRAIRHTFSDAPWSVPNSESHFVPWGGGRPTPLEVAGARLLYDGLLDDACWISDKGEDRADKYGNPVAVESGNTTERCDRLAAEVSNVHAEGVAFPRGRGRPERGQAASSKSTGLR